jgi:aspartate aminotransferase
MLGEYRKRREFVIPRLRKMAGVKCQNPMGAFYAYPNVRGAMKNLGINTSLEFAERLLKEAHVATVPGEAFGTEDHIRISYAASMKELERGLDRLENFILQKKG